MAKKVTQLEVSGSFSFKKTNIEFLGSDRIALLEKIDECGSITKAAKAVGICYKTAWDTIDAINNLSDKPLFVRMTGGKSGGGTVLTDEGREVIRKYKIIQEEHEKFLSNLEDKMGNAENLYRFLKRISMKVSARNIFSGKVVKIVKGAVNAEVTLALKGGDSIVSIITNESVETLALKEGIDAYAIIKASSVLIGADLNGTKISTRNILCGNIINFTRGAVNSELSLELSGGNTISAVITNESAIELGLSEGSQASAIFKASDVILGIS